MDKINPLVTVIVTTFNRKDYLRETIDSILKQTYKNFELIVVDNYSNYDFLSYMKSFNDVRIRAFQNQNDGIIAVNRNVGIKKAKGEYIAFCDDDDLWLRTKLNKQIIFFEESSCSFSSTSKLLIDSNGNEVKEKYINRVTKLLFKKISYKNLFFSNQICTSSVIIKRKFLGKLLFDDDPLMIAVEDYGLWLQLLKKNEDAYKKLTEELVLYSVGGDSSNWRRQQLRSFYCLTKHVMQQGDNSLYPHLVNIFFYHFMKSLFK